MKTHLLIASALLAFTCTTVLGAPEKLSPADQAAAFKAAEIGRASCRERV